LWCATLSRKRGDKVIWTPELDERLILLRKSLSQRSVAERLTQEFGITITRDMVRHREEAIRRGEHIRSEGNLFPDYAYTAHKNFTHIDEKLERMREIYDTFAGKKCFILSFSDLHSPLIDFVMIDHVLKKYQPIIEQKRREGYVIIILLNGDIFDFSQMSKFAKGKHRINVKEEIKLAQELINVCCQIADYCVALLGNHDARLYQYIARLAEKDPEVIEYMEEKLDPLKEIEHKNFMYINHIELQIGGMVFVHPFTFSKVAMRTAQNVKNAILANRDMMPNPQKIQGICMGHTHQVGYYLENGVLLIEQGHASHDPDYRLERKTDRKWVKGYAVIQLDENGDIDLEETRAIPYVERKEALA